MSSTSIRLLVADQHACIREALRVLLQDTDVDIVAEAMTAEAAVELAQEPSLDVALLDLSWSDQPTGRYGLQLLGQIAALRPDLPVVIYSVYDSERYVDHCRDLGARGYVVKGAEPRSLLDAIHVAAAGHAWRVYQPVCDLGHSGKTVS